MKICLKTFHGVLNAGDIAGPYLMSRITGLEIERLALLELSEREHYMTVGSTLRRADHNTIVWGSGLIRSDIAPMAPPKHIIGVRGYGTQKRLEALGLGTAAVIGDPGLLMSAFFRPDIPVRHDVGLIPHYVDEEAPFCQEVRARGGLVISPRQALESYLTQLLSCRCIVSSSLHGLIFAHAYGIPAIWIELSEKVIGAGFKFCDYSSFFGPDYAGLARWTPEQSFEANIAKANCPSLPASLWDSLALLRDDLCARGYIPA